MAPLVVLAFITIVVRIIGLIGVAAVNSWSVSIAVGLAAMFLMTGATHFLGARRRGFIAIVPPRLPAPGVLVSISGVLEIAGAVGLLVPATRVPAAICLGLLLLALFPANVYAAGAKRHPDAPNTPLIPRTVYQVVFLVAAVLVALGG